MKEIWELSPEEFHGTLTPNGQSDDLWSFGGATTAAEMLAQPLGLPATDFTASNGAAYLFIPVQAPGDFVVLEKTTAMAVGFKSGPTIAVADDHRKRGIGVELVLLAYRSAPRPLNPTLDVTVGGMKTVMKAHRTAVERAFRSGEANFHRYGLIP